MSHPMSQTNIHSTAIIDPLAEIGAGTTIGPYSCIGADVRIGQGCRIGPHVVIHPYATLGDRCQVHANAVIADLPQDVGFENEPSYVVVGSDTRIREGVTIHRGSKPGSTTRIGDHCFLMSNAHFAHDVQLQDRVIVVSGALIAGYAEIGEGAFISGNATIHQFVRIGPLAMIAGLSGITKDVPPYCTTHSCATNGVHSLNVVGMRRAGLSPEERKAIKAAFKNLYHSGKNVSQALSEVVWSECSEAEHQFWTFISESTRGICGLYQGRKVE